LPRPRFEPAASQLQIRHSTTQPLAHLGYRHIKQMRRCILDCEQSIHHEVWELRARVSKNTQHLALSQFDSIGLGVGGKGNYSIIGYHNTVCTDAHKKQTCLLHSKFWGPIPAVSMDDGSTPLHMISRLSSCQPRNQPRFGGMAAATASVETSRRVCVCVS